MTTFICYQSRHAFLCWDLKFHVLARKIFIYAFSRQIVLSFINIETLKYKFTDLSVATQLQ
jgi:hypothetical protein